MFVCTGRHLPALRLPNRRREEHPQGLFARICPGISGQRHHRFAQIPHWRLQFYHQTPGIRLVQFFCRVAIHQYKCQRSHPRPGILQQRALGGRKSQWPSQLAKHLADKQYRIAGIRTCFSRKHHRVPAQRGAALLHHGFRHPAAAICAGYPAGPLPSATGGQYCCQQQQRVRGHGHQPERRRGHGLF
jgi:hypothetical protein